jgi:hypothetical protein
MASTWVKVEGPPSREVFVNGQLVDPAGFTNRPFTVDIGQNTFLLLTSAHDIEVETTVLVGEATEERPFLVQLWPAVRAAAPRTKKPRRSARKKPSAKPRRTRKAR